MARGDIRLLGLTGARWSILASFVNVLGALGLLFGIWQYTDSVEANRASKTLDLIGEWDKEGYRDHFANLREATSAIATSITPGELKSLLEGGEDSDLVGQRIAAMAFGRDAGLEAAFSEVVYFFNFLGLCIEADVCSSKTAATFFREPFSNFHDFYGPEINRRRAEESGYASGVGTLDACFSGGWFDC